MHYRPIKPNLKYAAQIWQTEETFPRFFRDASKVWHKDFAAFLEFWENCGEIYGLFGDDENLISVVYLETLADHAVNIHVSVLEKCDTEIIIKFFASLVRQKRSEGVTDMQTFILDKNRHLKRIALQTGFRESGLVMRFGESHGRILKWLEFKR